ncbi:MAG TPA: AraC family transcriptional regulator [Bacillaceae bacterium]|nr:AraC family transcriptional regulator [Bacillaceae bacterium]
MASKYDYITVDAYYSLKFDFYHMEYHHHNSFELMYVVNGECYVDVKGDSSILAKGECIFIDRNTPHRLIVKEGNPCEIMNVEFRFISNEKPMLNFSELIKRVGIVRDLFAVLKDFLVIKDNGKLDYALKELILELEMNSPHHNSYIIHLLLAKMLIELARSYEGAHTSISYVRKAQEYIQHYLDEDPSIVDVAKHVGIHKSYLQKIFKQQVHLGLVEYKNQLRINKAKHLLRNSKLSIMDIAFEVGFNSRQHFYYVFEKTQGVSPREYREKYAFLQEVDTESFKFFRE